MRVRSRHSAVTTRSQSSRESRLVDDLGAWRCQPLVDKAEWPGRSARADARNIRNASASPASKNNCVPSLIWRPLAVPAPTPVAVMTE